MQDTFITIIIFITYFPSSSYSWYSSVKRVHVVVAMTSSDGRLRVRACVCVGVCMRGCVCVDVCGGVSVSAHLTAPDRRVQRCSPHARGSNNAHESRSVHGSSARASRSERRRRRRRR